nr:fluoride efflux transporter CrcB [Kocuria massiliensis]
MSGVVFLAVCLAGGLGAVLRMLVDGWVKSLVGASLPWATAVINVSGSLALGLVTGLATSHVLTPEVQAAVGTGLLGGYTTFSTASVEAFRLVQVKRWNASLVYAFGMILLGVVAAGCGLWIGTM